MKMKSIFLSMLAILTLASCSRDEVTTDIESGEGAYLGLNITLPAGSFSRVADANDANAEETEVAVKKVSVYTQSVMGGALTGPVDLVASNFDKVNNIYTLKETSAIKIMGVVGDKVNVYVVLNGAVAMNANLAGSPGVPPTAYAAGVDVTAKSGEFLFANAEPAKATMMATAADAVGAANRAAVVVERAVAKVMVKSSATFDMTGDIADLGKTGLFDNTTLGWTLGNSPKSLYVSRYTDGGVVKTPQYTHDANNAFDFYNTNYDLRYDAAGAATVYTPVKIAPAAAPATGIDGANSYVAYSNENIHDTYVVGNTTYILVTGQFTPTTVLEDLKGVDMDMVGTPVATPTKNGTFYYYTETRAYVTKGAYDDYVKTGGIGQGKESHFVGPYTNGLCFYRIPVWDNTNADTKLKGVERNTFYTIAINSITAPGFPADPTHPDPNNPNEEVEVFVGVAITVAPWAQKDMGSVDLK